MQAIAQRRITSHTAMAKSVAGRLYRSAEITFCHHHDQKHEYPCHLSVKIQISCYGPLPA